MAFALDWHRPARQMIHTGYWYIHTDQYRYDTFDADTLSAKEFGNDLFDKKVTSDLYVQSAKLGWMPFFPQFEKSPLVLADEAAAAGQEAPAYIVDQLKRGSLKFAVEDPDNPENFPRALTLWRSNLIGNTAKGDEYFLRHLLGTDHAVTAAEAEGEMRPKDMVWREQAPEGKLDLLLTLDFRMTSSTLMSDVLLPAATWYEKHDINTTDMHPFIHPFTPAITPPWQAKTDWETFQLIADKLSELAEDHLGVRKDVMATPLMHDSPDAMAMPHGVVRDWSKGEVDPIPAVTMPRLTVVERDYTAIGAKYGTVGPLLDKLGTAQKGLVTDVTSAIAYLKGKNGTAAAARRRPSAAGQWDRRRRGDHVAGRHHQRAPGHPGVQDLGETDRRAAARPGGRARGQAHQVPGHRRPAAAGVTSPEWSGSESGGRRYAPVHHQRGTHEAVAHAHRAHALLPRPRLDDRARRAAAHLPWPPQHDPAVRRGPPGEVNELGVSVRYLTPHFKWAIHSQYQDNWFMQTLSRGGQQIWLSPQDAAKVGIKDNDWSSWSTAMASSAAARSSRTACPRAPCTCTTPRIASSRCR